MNIISPFIPASQHACIFVFYKVHVFILHQFVFIYFVIHFLVLCLFVFFQLIYELIAGHPWISFINVATSAFVFDSVLKDQTGRQRGALWGLSCHICLGG